MSRKFAFIAAIIVQFFYGITFTLADEVLDGGYIAPYGFILLRIVGATVLFWLFSLFTKREKIAPKDFLTFIVASFFGIALNMLTFFKGLSYTTPINASVIMITVPIVVLILSAIILKEKLTSLKIGGVVLGCLGALILSVYGKSTQASDNVLLGNLLVFINAVSFSFYIIIVKKLTAKYHPYTFIKWLFLIGMLMVLPFGYQELQAVEWTSFNPRITFNVVFVVVAATFGTYMLNPLALRQLKASTVSTFLYLQPVIAGIFAIIMGRDVLDTVKLVAACLIFIGVYLVSKPVKKSTKN